MTTRHRAFVVATASVELRVGRERERVAGLGAVERDDRHVIVDVVPELGVAAHDDCTRSRSSRFSTLPARVAGQFVVDDPHVRGHLERGEPRGDVVADVVLGRASRRRGRERPRRPLRRAGRAGRR